MFAYLPISSTVYVTRTPTLLALRDLEVPVNTTLASLVEVFIGPGFLNLHSLCSEAALLSMPSKNLMLSYRHGGRPLIP